MAMPGHFVLYKLIKHLAPAGYTITFEDKDDWAPNQVGFLAKGNQVSEYRSLETGKRFEKIALVTLNVTGDVGRTSKINTSKWIEDVRDILIQKHNVIYYVLDGVTSNGEPDCTIYDEKQAGAYYVFIREVTNLSDAVPIGKSKQDFPVYTIDFKILYSVGGN